MLQPRSIVLRLSPICALLVFGLTLLPAAPISSNTVTREALNTRERITGPGLPGHPGSKALKAPASAASPQQSNEIVQENSLPGNPRSDWDLEITGTDFALEGFATDMSVDKGQTVSFKINTHVAVTAYHLDIYRIGYYQGNGARRVATVLPSVNPPQVQPECITDTNTLLTDCGNWEVSASWNVPSNAVSGVYVAKLVSAIHNPQESRPGRHIIFVVRDDNGNSDLLFQTSDTTWQAYNGMNAGTGSKGQSTYDNPRAVKVSYNRPFNTYNGRNGFFYSEYPMVRWLEANGYDVSYFTGVDSDWRGSEILEHKVFLSVGHDEYWSGGQRSNVETARNQGINLAFLSGNEIFWKTRWENSIDGSSTPYRTLVVYKETHDNAKTDPVCNAWTGTWRDPRFSPPGDGGRPENSLTGQLFTVNDLGDQFLSIAVPQSYGRTRLWRNTQFASLQSGQTGTTATATLGYEFDEPLDNGFLPGGLAKMSSITLAVGSYILDYGNTYGPGTATHQLTLYRQPGGGLVFGAGTIQWSWGLDAMHFNPANIQNLSADTNMKQATVNLFADMGSQPGSLQPGLVAASASTDTTPPDSVITSPSNGATVGGDEITISGTASDSGGGVIAAVEVSVDGGASWHPATGQETWSYVLKFSQLGPVTIESRAVDDSANTQTTPTSITITVKPPSQSYTIWTDPISPGISGDSAAYELGVKFRANTPGVITGVRFYKGAGSTGTHFGRLWDKEGNQLAAATFSNETSSGWQQVNFSNPVAINADTTYIASYYAPNGHFAASPNYFLSSGFQNRFLRALKDGEDGPNSVYAFGQGFPTQTYFSTNYWVDIVFVPQLSIWPEPISPGISGDTAAYELGVKFRSYVAGWITGVRFYKDVNNTGTHLGRLWDTQGNQLATVTFSNETSSGWQQVTFPNPVLINPDTTYIVSYYAPHGRFAGTPNYFASSAFENGLLKALKDGEDGPNSVYAFGQGFPTQSYLSTNYWVDVMFLPNTTTPNSLSLNGAGAYVNVPDSDNLDITGAVTVEAWIKTNSASTQQGIIERYGQYPAADGGYALRLTSLGRLRFYTLQNNVLVDLVESSAAISTGTWHHVAGVFDGQQLRAYVDGVLVASKPSTFAPAAGTTSVKIGARADDGAFSFNGLIDEARVTARAIYCPGTNFTPPPKLEMLTNTRGLWKFDGRTTRDDTNNSNHGTLVGGASFSTSVP